MIATQASHERTGISAELAARVLVVGALVLGLQAFAIAGPPSASRWQRLPDDPRWVVGQLELGAPSSVVWTRVADVTTWPRLFSDMTSFSVRSRSTDAARWVIRFESRSFGHGEHTYYVSLESAKQTATVVLDALGVRATAYATLTDAGGGRSWARYALFVETYGFFGWFVSERDLRASQERLVERTLVDLQRTFGTGRAP